jgi:membrane-associated phospholipid phosphatase
MSVAPDFQRLLRRSLAALAVSAILVTVCYWFVDRPFAFFVYNHKVSRHVILEWFTYPPPIVQSWTPALLAVLMIRRAWGPFRRWETALLAAGLSLVIADQCRQSLSWVFGRYWPATWIDNNPSLIGNGAYGFHPFHSGPAYGSFPSGHTARTIAVAAVFWIAYPKWRWACVAGSGLVIIGLLGMNYHFVSDVIAGGFVGAIVSAYFATFLSLAQPSAGASPNNLAGKRRA